jgi:hypothetical protein
MTQETLHYLVQIKEDLAVPQYSNMLLLEQHAFYTNIGAASFIMTPTHHHLERIIDFSFPYLRSRMIAIKASNKGI